MELRTLGTQGLEVSAFGLGCMGMSDFYGTAEERDESEAIATIDRAAELGVTMLDTADMYGPFTNEQLIGKALTGRRDQFIVATKFGFVRQTDGSQTINGRPELRAPSVRRLPAASRRRRDRPVLPAPSGSLGADRGDGRRDGGARRGGEGALSRAERGGLGNRFAVRMRCIPSPQCSRSTRCSRATSRSAVLPALRELGIGFVAYSPLGRGILTAALTPETLVATDIRRSRFPRFAEGNFEANVAIAARIGAIATERGVTAAQLALAWLLHQGKDIVPIPGTKRRSRLEENAAAAEVALDTDDIARLEAVASPENVRGERHWDMAAIDH